MSEWTKGDIVRLILHIIIQVITLIAGVLVVAIGVLGFVPQANSVVSNSTVDIRSVVLTVYYMYV